jgi:hypothetical protein
MALERLAVVCRVMQHYHIGWYLNQSNQGSLVNDETNLHRETFFQSLIQCNGRGVEMNSCLDD